MTQSHSLFGILLSAAILAQPACGATSFSSDEESTAGDDAGAGGSGSTSGKGGSGGSASGKGGSGTAGAGRGGSAGAEAGRGGSAGAGANGGQAGTSAGSSGTAGLGGCGFCPAVACFAPVLLNVSSESPTAGIQDLSIESDDLDMNCLGGGLAPCQWTCNSQQFGIADGHYSVRLSAPGYETQTVEFDVVNPTNCGCCGCGCGPNIQMNVTLEPNGDPVGNCCAMLASDPNHCGECNNSCNARICSDGECEGSGGSGGTAGTGGTSGSAGTGGSANCSPPVPPESDPNCPSDLAALQAQPCDQSGMECYQLDALGSDPCEGYSSTNALCCDGTWQLSWTSYPPGTSWLNPICAIAAN